MKKLTLFSVPATLAFAVSLAGCQQDGGTNGTDNAAAATDATAAQASPAPDVSGLVASIDTDSDGQISAGEWAAQSLPESAFTFLAGDKGHVTATDFAANPAPEGVDIDGDGAVTLEEFKAFSAEVADAPDIG